MSSNRELIEDENDFGAASDDMLALAAKQGGQEARNALYLRHLHSINPHMLAPANRLLSIISEIDSSIEREDVSQQAFLIFCHLLDSWHGNPDEEPFLSYLARLLPSHVTHFVRDTLHYRARKRVPFASAQFRDEESRQPVEHHQPQFGHLLNPQIENNIFSELGMKPEDPEDEWEINSRSIPLRDVEEGEARVPFTENNQQVEGNQSVIDRKYWPVSKPPTTSSAELGIAEQPMPMPTHTLSLTEQMKRSIILRYNFGLTTAQIADLCGLSKRTVDRHLKAALTQIRHHILSTWEDCA